ESLAYEGVVVRVTVKTAPMEQWAVARALRERIKARFDHEDISIPHPPRFVTTTSPTSADQTAEAARPAPLHNGHVSAYSAATGGAGPVRAIEHRFCAGAAGAEVLRAMSPEADLWPAEDRFGLFLIQSWGGPTT